jgi:hypothetical protein
MPVLVSSSKKAIVRLKAEGSQCTDSARPASRTSWSTGDATVASAVLGGVGFHEYA